MRGSSALSGWKAKWPSWSTTACGVVLRNIFGTLGTAGFAQCPITPVGPGSAPWKPRRPLTVAPQWRVAAVFPGHRKTLSMRVTVSRRDCTMRAPTSKHCANCSSNTRKWRTRPRSVRSGWNRGTRLGIGWCRAGIVPEVHHFGQVGSDPASDNNCRLSTAESLASLVVVQKAAPRSSERKTRGRSRSTGVPGARVQSRRDAARYAGIAWRSGAVWRPAPLHLLRSRSVMWMRSLSARMSGQCSCPGIRPMSHKCVTSCGAGP